MSTSLSASEIIASALQLPLADREAVVVALQESLIDHGPEEPADEVEAAWADEIARRIAEIDSGSVKTIPSEEAWKYIERGERIIGVAVAHLKRRPGYWRHRLAD
jgi:putative addiction module component (TIGR02574 family)